MLNFCLECGHFGMMNLTFMSVSSSNFLYFLSVMAQNVEYSFPEC